MNVKHVPAVIGVVEPEKVVVEFTPAQAKVVGALLSQVVCADLRRLGFSEHQSSAQLGYLWEDRGMLVNIRAGQPLSPRGDDNGVAFQVRE